MISGNDRFCWGQKMSLGGNRLDHGRTLATEDETSLHVIDEWLRLENETTNPGFLLPDRTAVVTWCENHSGAVILSANVILWTPLIWVMCRG
jgi:hypothetical protein